MFSRFASHPSRTHTASLNPIPLGDGSMQLEFSQSPSERYIIIEHLPPFIPSQPETHFTPPYHWHSVQEETFWVRKGTMLATLEGRERVIPEGGSITIPMQAFHTFRNASDTERASIEIGLNPSTRAKDECFFRNAHSYLEDCKKANMQPNILQLLLMFHENNVIMALPGPKFIAKPLGVLMNWIGGVVLGKWLMGYSHTYKEYFHPETQ
ncbi:hypothetical protein BOTBODRAFT_31796 [Botryobasidium botryosum FD-172 SS1]|uniref:Cupin type-2 domain-containing protein n=1 Tax=Botryobasidium botryosum (strain FD-172 SS1) TaxID=930990 RepID=A0A067MUD2_BOTB1|nr:hypothetical protein BOTBODRAFT_31796 [Botryobasidium botryosum FD-172 SS1]